MWSAFLEEFRKKFIPRVVRERKEEEYIGLKQKTLTVSQYEVQFTKLLRYAPDIVNTEEKRKKRFLQGLNIEIQRLLVPTKVDTYADMVEFAQKAEECEIKWKDYLNAKRSNFKNWKNTTGSSSQGQARDKGKRKMRQTCRYCESITTRRVSVGRKLKSVLSMVVQSI